MKDAMNEQDLIYRLRKRAEIRRQISTRKSVQEGKPDRISDLLEEAANEIERLRSRVIEAELASRTTGLRAHDFPSVAVEPDALRESLQRECSHRSLAWLNSDGWECNTCGKIERKTR